MNRNTTLRVLVIGSAGQVGWELMGAFPPTYDVRGVNRTQLDLTDIQAVRACLRQVRPEVIVNAAAYTAVDQAEHDPELARAINTTAVEVMGEEARKLGTAVVHFSTDYVFDGAKRSPYLPEDTPNPLSVYGRTKLDGELALLASGASAIIIRTSWVYGTRGRNFLLSMLRLAATKPEIRVVADQVGSPTWCRSIAHAAAHIITTAVQGDSDRRSFDQFAGIYHFTGGGATTWYHFAQRIFEIADLPQQPVILPISTDEYPAAACRPRYSVLDCRKTEQTFDLLLPDWEQALQQALDSCASPHALAAMTVPGDDQ